jgi:prepilin-type N-terminal cleavage/methylation domain-containing protein
MSIPAKTSRRAMTLAEMLLALTILAVMSTAVFAMVQVGGRANSTVNASITTDLEVEAALARIVQLGRTCTALSVPSGTTAGTTFTIQTQPDAANGNQTYDITYTYANGQLTETQYLHGTTTPRFTNASTVIIRNVQAFSVMLKSVAPPQVAIISITAGTGPRAARTIRFTPRNQ